MPLEQIISVCKCPQCESILFETITIAIIQQTDSGNFSDVVSTEAKRCICCSTILKSKRITGMGQSETIRRFISERLPEKTAEPASERIDLNEVTGAKKKQLNAPGGLSGAGTPFAKA